MVTHTQTTTETTTARPTKGYIVLTEREVKGLLRKFKEENEKILALDLNLMDEEDDVNGEVMVRFAEWFV